MNTAGTTKQSSHTAFWIAIILLSILLLFSLTANFALIAGMAVMGMESDAPSRARDEFPRFQEQWSYGSGEHKAVRIPVTGIITRHQSKSLMFMDQHDPAESIQRRIRAASNDKNVLAIILEINSPGGEIAAIDAIHDTLLDFKKSREDRKIIAFVQGLAASGGYYTAMASDWIVAEPTSVVGSISAIMQTLNWKQLSDKIGIHDVTIKTGDNKDMLNPFSEVSSDQLALLQELLDAVHHRFVDVVLAGRNMEPALLKQLDDGRIFTIPQALDYNLVDQAGYWKDVVTMASELTGKPSLKIVRYQERSRPSLLRMFSQILQPFNPSPWINSQGPRLMYLWSP